LTIFFDGLHAPKAEEGPQLGRKLSANASSKNFVVKEFMVRFKEFVP
jgi:hypothetical protein